MQLSLLTLYFVALTTTLFAQSTPQRPNNLHQVIPPSPTAASLGVYGELNVGYYTGLPDISIPLYEVKGQTINLPIRLQYNASGTRVAASASWVGLGWSLSAGGVITRTVQGLDDFKNNGDAGTGYYYAAALPSPSPARDYDPAKSSVTDPARLYFDAVSSGGQDVEPDNFNYNFGSFAGKFVLGKSQDGSVIFVDERNNLKIEYMKPSWRITDSNGYKYLFDIQEESTSYTYNSTGSEAQNNISLLDLTLQPDKASVTTAWYLSSITSPSGETVKLDYTRGESISLLSKSEEEDDLLSILSYVAGSPSVPATKLLYSASKQVITDIYLKKITFSQGSIEFNTSYREDVDFKDATRKPAKLSDIIIKNKVGDIIKKYTLNYSYFALEGIQNNKLLKLDSVVDYGQNGAAIPPYLFTYDSPNALPSPYDKSIDHWGYYNGHINNKRLVPAVSVPGFNKNFTGADRRSNQSRIYPKIGTLTSITYPTGGKTVFDYELNIYTNLEGDDRYEDIDSLIEVKSSSSDMINNYKSFHIGISGTTLKVNYTYFREQPYKYDCELCGIIKYIFAVEKKGEFNQWEEVFLQDNTRTDYTTSPSTQIILSEGGGYADFPLQKGDYRLHIYPVQGYKINFTAAWQERYILDERKGDGLRIKSIKNYDQNKLVKQRDFIYTYDGKSTGKSSGLLITQPQYEASLFVSYAGGIDPGKLSTYSFLQRRSSSLYPIGLASKGGIVAYGKVTEVVSSIEEGGSAVYTYFNTPDGLPEFYYLPTVSSPANGRLTQSALYNSSGALLKKTDYSYDQKESASLLGAKLYKTPYPNQESGGYLIKYYDTPSRWLVLSSQTETNYQNGQPFTVRKTFSYDNPVHREITREQTTTGPDRSLITHYLYPSDYANTTGFIGEMKTANILSKPVEQIMAVADAAGNKLQILSAALTIYATGTSLGLPAQQWNLETAAPVPLAQFQFSNQAAKGTLPTAGPPVAFALTNKDAHYPATANVQMAYDAQGQIQQVQKDKDVPTVYLWGYANTLPVAQIQNATKAQVDAALSALGLSAATLPTDEQPLRDACRNLRQRLPQARITSLTYRPLVGMTSQTDPSGRTTTYEYDAFNRLLRVRDEQGRILTQQEYKYALQP